MAPDGSEERLENKAMDVLVELARRPHETISEDEFLDTVWTGRVVTPQVLSRSIHLARAALGDSAERSAFIRTVPNAGYELVVDVAPLKRSLRWPLLTAAGILIGTALLASVAYRWWNEPAKIAVLPLTAPNLQGIPAGGESLADYLTSALTAAPDLAVVPRREAFSITDAHTDVESIGQALDADYLIGGAIRQDETTINVTLTLTDTEAEAEIWTEVITGKPGRPAELQKAALAALSAALEKQRLGIDAIAGRTPAPDVDPRAYNLHLRAQYQWSLRGARRIDQAIRLNQEAITLSPAFAEAHLALAQALAIRPFYTTDPLADRFAEARAALKEVRKLTRDLDSEVSALEGFMAMEEHRWADARSSLQEALALSPDNALAHYWYSHLLSIFGDFDAALSAMQRADALRPDSAVINDRLALAYLWVNDSASAAASYAAAIDLGYLESNQVKPAVLLALRTQNWGAIRATLLRLGNEAGWVEAFVGALADPGTATEAALIIEDAIARGEVAREFWFGIWVLLGDVNRAVAAFDAGEKSQDIELLWAAEAAFLRVDPRFGDLLDAVGLRPFVSARALAANPDLR
ncbi:MAG: winged helix-turn-helix domain-containing protein, partial [Pseudomonadota bacterium]